MQIRKSVPYEQVSDLPGAIGFYRDVLGYQVRQALRDEGGAVFFASLERGADSIMLSSRPVHDRSRLTWLYVDDVEGAHERLREVGARIVFPPADQEHGNREFLVEGPGGRAIVIAEPLRPALEERPRDEVIVREMLGGDRDAWLQARRDLFNGEPESLLEEEERQIESGRFPGGECVVLISVFASSPDRVVGMAEVNIRSGAEGCMTSPVVYLEAWWVAPEARGRGVGRALVDGAAEWGRSRGCREMASDTEAYNAASQDAHRALGFEVLESIVCFRKGI